MLSYSRYGTGSLVWVRSRSGVGWSGIINRRNASPEARSEDSSLSARDFIVASRGEPASVQIEAYFLAETGALFGMTKCSRMKLQSRGLMGQMRGSMRNWDRYLRTAFLVGAAGVPVFAMTTPTLPGTGTIFLLTGHHPFHRGRGRRLHEGVHLATGIRHPDRARRELVQGLGEIAGQLIGEGHGLAGCRMLEGDAVGMEELAAQADVIFTATPQGFCASIINEEILSKVKVVDLSADFRIKDVKVYEEWYKITHKSPQFIDEAVYGLCEINREDVKKARLVANPGCYPTCSTLSIYPMVKEGLIHPNTIIIDAKSGTSGAGRGAKVDNLYCEVNENMKAYGVSTHRHTPEIEEQLGYAAGEKVVLNFTPHLAPMNRGILVTAYASLKKEVTYDEVKAVYDKYDGTEKFVRVRHEDVCPQTKWVEGNN